MVIDDCNYNIKNIYNATQHTAQRKTIMPVFILLLSFEKEQVFQMQVSSQQ